MATSKRPRTIRNFWIEGVIDGQPTPIAGGPKTKEGGFYITILQRNEGKVMRAMHIKGHALQDGTLFINVEDKDGNSVFQVVTKR